jgi:prevent-host-death family protein
MREVQSSEAKAKLAEMLDAVESGETIVVTRHGKPIAHIVPAPAAEKSRVQQALDGIEALRKTTGRMPLKEILAARHEGHKR